MSNPKEWPLGRAVTFTAILERGTQHAEAWHLPSKRLWVRVEGGQRAGVFVGWRTLSNGERDYEEESGYWYAGTEFFPAALVAYHPRRALVLVPFDALEARP